VPATPAAESEPPASQTIADRVVEVLAKEGRINKLKLCERSGVGIPEFNRCVIEMVESGRLKSEEVEDTTEVYLAYSEQETRRYDGLLQRAKSDDPFLAVKEIHDEKLYRHYRSWDEWLHYELGREHDWWTTECRRYDTLRLLAEKGIKFKIPLNKALLLELAKGRDRPEVFVAVVSEFQALAEKRQIAKELKAIVDRHLARARKLDSLRRSVPDVTGDEVALLEPLGDRRWPNRWKDDWTAGIREQVAAGRPLVDCLAERCEEVEELPDDATLLGLARGHDLLEVVNWLRSLQRKWDGEAEKEKRRKELRREAERLGLQIFDPAAPPPADEPRAVGVQAATPLDQAAPPAAEAPPVSAATTVTTVEEQEASYDVELSGDFLACSPTERFESIGSEELANLLSEIAVFIGDGDLMIRNRSGITILPASAAAQRGQG
jgi:hypothetical protein